MVFQCTFLVQIHCAGKMHDTSAHKTNALQKLLVGCMQAVCVWVSNTHGYFERKWNVGVVKVVGAVRA